MNKLSSTTSVKAESVVSDYDTFVDETCTYRDPVYPVLGLAGECGEFVELVKKAWRKREWPGGAHGDKWISELGDIVWYVTRLAHLLGYDLADVLDYNMRKLKDRAINGKREELPVDREERVS